MQDSEVRKMLKQKRIRNVKKLNPGIKKFLVNTINSTGKFFTLFRKDKLPGEVKKILFISLYFYGDILFHSGLFELVRKLYPDAEMHIWVKSRTKGILEGYPYFKTIHIFDDIRTRRFDENAKFNLKGKFRFFNSLRAEKYDLVYDVTGLFWTAFAVWMANPGYSSGLNFHGFGFIYNFETKALYNGHLVDNHLNLILMNKEYNIENRIAESARKPIYHTTQSSEAVVDNIFNDRGLLNGRKKIIIHTTAGWESKKWNINNFINIIHSLSNKYDILLIGGNEDKKNTELIINSISENVYDFTSQLSINESAELIRRADLYIGADSGPLYIAEAVGTPTLSLFGPTNPLFSAPRGLNHRFIYNELLCSSDKSFQNCKLNAGLNCKTFDCMKMIKPEEVLGLAHKLIWQIKIK